MADQRRVGQQEERLGDECPEGRDGEAGDLAVEYPGGKRRRPAQSVPLARPIEFIRW
ncbi:hypothetical protein GCM10022256_17290 [Frondihabitans peucedani]|uniref:Uncharacterized protein n=1 Tax=Frondihabitans peucedani TaxID=598626 RepID=A0ABP8E1P3_9MICO